MPSFLLPAQPFRWPLAPALRRPAMLAAALAILAALMLALVADAQVSGDRGIPPVARSGDILAGGIKVDVTGKNPEDARSNGWKLAQRKAWEKLGGPAISDSQLETMVSSIVIESESLGPRRYVATLGVIFDRARAGGPLGAGGGQQSHSAPMLTIPVLYAGGARTVFERRNEWQRAWAEYQAGASAIDYVRPVGSGGESLILNYGQVGRRSRSWWRNVLDQFGAADVLVPVAHLQRQWPGGPVTGTFTARYGPDNEYLGSFTLSARNEAEVPAMLARAIARFDALFTRALNDGKLRPDPTLRADRVAIDPRFAALIEAGRRAQAAENAADTRDAAPAQASETPDETPTPAPTETVINAFVVQVATPDAAAFDAALGSIRSTGGVRGAAVSSTAIGGTSVMRVSYGGDIGQLAAALRARGWQVNQGSNALSISR